MSNLNLSENVAEVTFNPKTKHITKMTLHQRHIRFRCQRCATFCCKLGGPKLTSRDIERIKQAGYKMEDLLEPVPNNKFKGLPTMCGSLKSRQDGSCAFLGFDAERSIHECSIYDVRPALCRLYPFYFEKVGPYSFVLKLIPCCRGLNDPRGEPVNEEFVINYIFDAILDLMTEYGMHVYEETCIDTERRV